MIDLYIKQEYLTWYASEGWMIDSDQELTPPGQVRLVLPSTTLTLLSGFGIAPDA
jgi:hypothetical protein